MYVALAELVHSNILPFLFLEEMKHKNVDDISRKLPSYYIPPNLHRVSGDILTYVYDINWGQEMKSLVLDANIFDVTLFGCGATLVTVLMVNVIGAGVHNNFARLDVFDCSCHCSNGGKKDALYIAIFFLSFKN